MAQPQTSDKVDVLIGGAGFAGLALAIALRHALGPAFKIVVADPALGRSSTDARASAIVAAARRLFETIGVWQAIAQEAQPILDMVVTDSRLDDAVRPVFLTFGGDVEPGEPFAHMVENPPLIAALLEKARAAGIELRAAAVENFSQDADRVTAQLTDGEIAARLLVAADGARSGIRRRAGIAIHGWDYSQSSIATTVAHEREHDGRAEEHFLPAGPFAILPLKGRRSSIVWTEDKHEAARIVALPEREFHAELERRFGRHLGTIEAVGARRAYPLGLYVARAFVAERVALLGDAAHVIHPVAGQGLNMGLKDVAALAECIVDAARLGLDPGAAAALERYQRWRRFDTMAMGVATDGLNRLFSNQSDVLRLMRDLGLGLVDRVAPLKDLFIREAAGLSGEVPKLLRGEAL
ncbi:MAG: 2-octaprenyl-6-methoxyphenol hydroxylase [Alphaproteobacteria bacterium]|jgi:2-octaprenyl-6-methoxyphenol hydroxylase|nr:2-octaprenyl-6-methoxyphenol hydroxylase [Alphaproteobacteria bacterium]